MAQIAGLDSSQSILAKVTQSQTSQPLVLVKEAWPGVQSQRRYAAAVPFRQLRSVKAQRCVNPVDLRSSF